MKSRRRQAQEGQAGSDFPLEPRLPEYKVLVAMRTAIRSAFRATFVDQYLRLIVAELRVHI